MWCSMQRVRRDWEHVLLRQCGVIVSAASESEAKSHPGSGLTLSSLSSLVLVLVVDLSEHAGSANRFLQKPRLHRPG